MARKESVTKDMIIETAFALARKEGVAEVTARKLAGRIGCSTQPVFRVYKNMDELIMEVYEKAVVFFDEYCDKFPKEEIPFVHLGKAYITFAQEELHLFRLLFLSDVRGGRSLYGLLNGKNGKVIAEINKVKELGGKNGSEVFMKMWIFIHGSACMSVTKDYDLSIEETTALLQDTYRAFVKM